MTSLVICLLPQYTPCSLIFVIAMRGSSMLGICPPNIPTNASVAPFDMYIKYIVTIIHMTLSFLYLQMLMLQGSFQL